MVNLLGRHLSVFSPGKLCHQDCVWSGENSLKNCLGLRYKSIGFFIDHLNFASLFDANPHVSHL